MPHCACCRHWPGRALSKTAARVAFAARHHSAGDGNSRQYAYGVIPPEYWTVRALNEDELAVRGAVLVRVKRRTETPVDLSTLPVEVAAAITEPPPRPAAELWRLLKQDGALAPAMVTAALLVSAAGTVLQTLLFRGIDFRRRPALGTRATVGRRVGRAGSTSGFAGP